MKSDTWAKFSRLIILAQSVFRTETAFLEAALSIWFSFDVSGRPQGSMNEKSPVGCVYCCGVWGQVGKNRWTGKFQPIEGTAPPLR